MVGRRRSPSRRPAESAIANGSKSSSSTLLLDDEMESRSCLKMRLPGRKSSVAGTASVFHEYDDEEEEVGLLRGQSSTNYSQQPLGGGESSLWESFSSAKAAPITPAAAPATNSDRLKYEKKHPKQSMESLLVPPKPVDRSPQTLAMQKQKQKRNSTRTRPGLYDGEIEPEGVRGQEAVVPRPRNTRSTSSGDIQPTMRTDFASSGATQQKNSITPPRQNTTHNATTPTSTKRNNPSAAPHGTDTRRHYVPSSARRRRQRQQPQTPAQQDESSNNSDDELRLMLPDLMPFDEGTPRQKTSSPAVVSTDSRPSKAAQRAAAAAAAVAATGLPPPQNDLLEELNARAMEHVQRREYDQALDDFTTVLQIQQDQHPNATHPAVASAHHNLGTVHAKRAAVLPADSAAQRNARAAALECFQAAARTARDSLGPTHPNVAVSLVRIGFLLLQSRQYPAAVVTFQEALRIRIEHYGPRHGLVANLHNNLGVCYMHLAKFGAGFSELQQALAIQRHVVREQERRSSSTSEMWVHLLELADTLFNIGGLCLEWIRRQSPGVGRANDAEEAFRETLQVCLLMFVQVLFQICFSCARVFPRVRE